MNSEKIEEYEREFQIIYDLLKEWGEKSRFIWFREIDRLTGIDRGLLRNILNYLKKNKEIKEIQGQNKRVFFVLTKYYKACHQAELNYKGKSEIIEQKHSKVKGLSSTQKSIERTRKRIEKQQKRREVKLFSRAKHKRRINS